MAKKLSKTAYMKRTCGDMLVIQFILFASLIVFFTFLSKEALSLSNIVNVSVDCVAIPVLFLILLSAFRSKTPDKTVFSFSIIIFVETIYIFFDAMAYLLDGKEQYSNINLAVNTGNYICVVLMAALLWRFLCNWTGERSSIAGKLTAAVNTVSVFGILVILLNPFLEGYFVIDEGGRYGRGESFYLSFVFPAAIIILCIFYILKQKISASEKITFILYTLIPCLAMAYDSLVGGPRLMCIMIFISSVFVYSNIFVRRDETIARKQTELAESKLKAMLLQINPHFIYNTLGSISSLCHDDPDLAEKMLYSFSNYLRNNFGEMSQKNMITIEEELEHLDFYISIEKLRFPDIEVITDYKAPSFKLPSLSVQPLVENAIKHGILGRETGGTLRISTYEDKNYYCVCVEDDGVGFEQIEKHDGKNHIGVENVQNRLEMLCGGILSINSTVNVGTVAIIKIPK